MSLRPRDCLKPSRGRFFASLSAMSVLLVSSLFSPKAEARQKGVHEKVTHNVHGSRHGATRHASMIHTTRFTPRRHRTSGHVIQCVAYAKAASDVVLSGNAKDWWENSRGVYARGSAPEPGSVLNFRGIRRMPYGHVAVVRAIENDRTIIIDQSHWAQNGIAKNIRVIDVSPNNDWSAVRVAPSSHSESYGSIYPTYGFIYGRPDEGVMMASNGTDSEHRSPHSSSKTMTGLSTQQNLSDSTEIAEASDDAFTLERPSRNLR